MLGIFVVMCCFGEVLVKVGYWVEYLCIGDDCNWYSFVDNLFWLIE